MTQPQPSWYPPPPPSQKSNTRLILAIVIILVVVGGVLALGFYAVNRVSNAIGRQQVINIVNGGVTVKPGLAYAYQMRVPVGASAIHITGSFIASGDSAGAIEVLVMNYTNYFTWQQGYRSSAYFDSGLTTTGTISASLPSGGIYYLIYSNVLSQTIRNIQTTAYLYYLP